MSREIKKHTFKAGLPLEFEILNLEHVLRHPKEKLKKPHRLNFYSVIWFQEGTPTHVVDFNPIEIKPNTLLFLRKDSVHSFDVENKYSAKSILFTDSFFCQSESDTNFLKTTVLFNDLFSTSAIQLHENIKSFSGLFQLMQDELENKKDNFQTDILQNLLHTFLLLAERTLLNQNKIELRKGIDYDYVITFKNLLETSYISHKQVSYYAPLLNITQKRLSQATVKVLGQTPKEVIEARIILEAKRLLAHSKLSVKEISYTLGYDEPTYFIQFFKKHTQETPTEFRALQIKA